jgi:hypothetical protein
MPLPAGVAELAAASGSVPMLLLLRQRGVEYTRSASCQAADSGHLRALQFLHNLDCLIGWDARCAAARRGHLSLLKFMHGTGRTISHKVIVDAAAESGSVEVMAWLLEERGAERTPELLYIAATRCHEPLFDYLYTHGCPWSAELTEHYLQCDNLSALNWALSQGIEFTAEQQQRHEQLKAKQCEQQRCYDEQQRRYDKLEARRAQKRERKQLARAASASNQPA